MAVYSFDGTDLIMMLQGALDLLEQSREEINALNVFPVPDGDTGTNMYQTLEAAVNEAVKINSVYISLVAEAAARGGLVGARGNSGVILSQVLYGFARSLSNVEKASALDITRALEEGARMAYRAVTTPVEGTILTVIRKSAEGAGELRTTNLLRIMVSVLKKALIALQQTPDLLPVLKQAGVVDAGGKGFVVILEGFLQALKAASPSVKLPDERAVIKVKDTVTSLTMRDFNNIEHTVNFLYCTEFHVTGEKLQLNEIKQNLSPYGDCLMVVGEENLAKVHIHTNHPGLVLEYCLKVGSLHQLKISNMEDQKKEMSLNANAKQMGKVKDTGIISLGFGEGIIGIMKNLGADIVVAGGQTLNPSTGEILKAITDLNTEKTIILPNNKNIILAAEQAAKISKRDVIVLPSKSIPQGISALLTLNPLDNHLTTTNKMKEALTAVRTIEITKAIRDTDYKGLAAKKGWFIGLADGDLIAAGSEISQVLEDILTALLQDEGNLITFYYGEDIGPIRAEELLEKMQSLFRKHDFEIHNGGQPVYDFIISIE